MKWYTSKDGQRRVTIRIQHHLTREELANALAAYAAKMLDRDELGDRCLPKATIEKYIHQQVGDDYSGLPYWHEAIKQNGDGDHADRLIAWASKQVQAL
jgi:hypothetical protein